MGGKFSPGCCCTPCGSFTVAGLQGLEFISNLYMLLATSGDPNCPGPFSEVLPWLCLFESSGSDIRLSRSDHGDGRHAVILIDSVTLRQRRAEFYAGEDYRIYEWVSPGSSNMRIIDSNCRTCFGYGNGSLLVPSPGYAWFISRTPVNSVVTPRDWQVLVPGGPGVNCGCDGSIINDPRATQTSNPRPELDGWVMFGNLVGEGIGGDGSGPVHPPTCLPYTGSGTYAGFEWLGSWGPKNYSAIISTNPARRTFAGVTVSGYGGIGTIGGSAQIKSWAAPIFSGTPFSGVGRSRFTLETLNPSSGYECRMGDWDLAIG